MLGSIRIGTEELGRPVALAPMAGITDRPFRRLAARFGAPYVVSEMVASREMACARALSELRADMEGEPTLAAVQLAGCEARWMAEGARRVAGQGARIIDINMGCPAKKVVSGWSGSALMRDPDHALRLIEATVGAVDVPVTLKMRLGWDSDSLNAPQIARRAEAAGVRMICVHGRTREQRYTGQADWSLVRETVAAVSIPVLVNGDIRGTVDARRALKLSGAAGVMIGRATQGAPWRIGQIARALAGEPVPADPEGPVLRDIVLEHYEAMLSCYGCETGLRAARKHLGWWLADRPGGAALRGRVIRETDTTRVRAELAAFDWPPPLTQRLAA